MKWNVGSNVLSDAFVFSWLRVKGLLAILNLVGSTALKLDIILMVNFSPHHWLKHFSTFDFSPLMQSCFFLPLFYSLPSGSMKAHLSLNQRSSAGLWWSLPSSPNILGVSLCLKGIKAQFPSSSSEMAIEVCRSSVSQLLLIRQQLTYQEPWHTDPTEYMGNLKKYGLRTRASRASRSSNEEWQSHRRMEFLSFLWIYIDFTKWYWVRKTWGEFLNVKLFSLTVSTHTHTHFSRKKVCSAWTAFSPMLFFPQMSYWRGKKIIFFLQV